jgi:hypothetical protein
MSDQEKRTIAILLKFASDNAPCCAGCDWWRWSNSVVGECIKSAPVSANERYSMLGMTWCSAPARAGHILTPREHYCGDFKPDTSK